MSVNQNRHAAADCGSLKWMITLLTGGILSAIIGFAGSLYWELNYVGAVGAELRRWGDHEALALLDSAMTAQTLSTIAIVFGVLLMIAAIVLKLCKIKTNKTVYYASLAGIAVLLLVFVLTTFVPYMNFFDYIG